MNQASLQKKEFIKSFTIGFLPLLIYILVDDLYGLIPGIIAAVGFGAAEFFYTWIREKRVEYFVLMDVVLLSILGVISISFHNDLFIKLKPALMNGIFLVLIYITAFTPHPILIEMSLRRLKGITFEDFQLQAMKQMLRKFFYLILIHTLVIVYAAFYLSKEAWGFITGGLFYLMVGVIIAFEFIKRKIEQKKLWKLYEREEWFPLVDESGQPKGKAPRSVVHGNPQLLHPVVHLHVFNQKGELFLQKRSKDKEVAPGLWDTAVGGHVRVEETIEQALWREAREELGINNIPYEPLLRYVWTTSFESELIYVFRGYHNGPFRLHPTEISDGRFWSLKEIQKNIGKGVFTPNFENEFRMLMQIGIFA
jgi:isopentenyldiphosphate isomerase/intracellular septation protein A